MITSLTDTIEYEWNYSKRLDVITISHNPEFNSISIGKHGENMIEFNKETIPHLIKMLEKILKERD